MSNWWEQMEIPFLIDDKMTEEQKEILKKGLQESELPTDIGDRMEEDIKHILGNN